MLVYQRVGFRSPIGYHWNNKTSDRPAALHRLRGRRHVRPICRDIPGIWDLNLGSRGFMVISWGLMVFSGISWCLVEFIMVLFMALNANGNSNPSPVRCQCHQTTWLTGKTPINGYKWRFFDQPCLSTKQYTNHRHKEG